MPSPVHVYDFDFDHDTAFLVSEANGYQSREVGVITGGELLYAGTVLGRVTTSGALRRINPTATDGSQNAAALLLNRADAREGDVRQTVIARHAEANGLLMRVGTQWPAGITAGQRNAAIVQLADGPRILIRT